jgi:hypothetical protein
MYWRLTTDAVLYASTLGWADLPREVSAFTVLGWWLQRLTSVVNRCRELGSCELVS